MFVKPKIDVLKIISFVVVTCFTATSIVWSAPEHSATLANHSLASQVGRFSLDEKLGKIDEVFIPEDLSSNSPFLIYLQDAHTNIGAQNHISEIARVLGKEFKVDSILAEGGVGEFDFTELRAFPDQKIKERATEFWLKEAVLTGPSREAIIGPREYRFFGIEDKASYEEGGKHFVEAHAQAKSFLEQLRPLISKNQKIKKEKYNKALLSFEGTIQKFHSREELLELVSYMANLARDLHINRWKYLEIEKVIDLILLELQGGNPEQFFAVQKSIDVKKLFEQIDLLKNEIKEQLFENDEERAIDQEETILNVLKAIAALEATPSDYDYFLVHMKMIIEYMKGKKIESKDILSAEAFYKTARVRDEHLFSNIKSILNANQIKRAFLVTGGFHSPGITKELRKENIPFVLITPQISEEDNFKNYFARVSGKRANVEDFKKHLKPNQSTYAQLQPTRSELRTIHDSFKYLDELQTNLELLDLTQEKRVKKTLFQDFVKILAMTSFAIIGLSAVYAIYPGYGVRDVLGKSELDRKISLVNDQFKEAYSYFKKFETALSPQRSVLIFLNPTIRYLHLLKSKHLAQDQLSHLNSAIKGLRGHIIQVSRSLEEHSPKTQSEVLMKFNLHLRDLETALLDLRNFISRSEARNEPADTSHPKLDDEVVKTSEALSEYGRMFNLIQSINSQLVDAQVKAYTEPETIEPEILKSLSQAILDLQSQIDLLLQNFPQDEHAPNLQKILIGKIKQTLLYQQDLEKVISSLPSHRSEARTKIYTREKILKKIDEEVIEVLTESAGPSIQFGDDISDILSLGSDIKSENWREFIVALESVFKFEITDQMVRTWLGHKLVSIDAVVATIEKQLNRSEARMAKIRNFKPETISRIENGLDELIAKEQKITNENLGLLIRAGSDLINDYRHANSAFDDKFREAQDAYKNSKKKNQPETHLKEKPVEDAISNDLIHFIIQNPLFRFNKFSAIDLQTAINENQPNPIDDTQLSVAIQYLEKNSFLWSRETEGGIYGREFELTTKAEGKFVPDFKPPVYLEKGPLYERLRAEERRLIELFNKDPRFYFGFTNKELSEALSVNFSTANTWTTQLSRNGFIFTTVKKIRSSNSYISVYAPAREFLKKIKPLARSEARKNASQFSWKRLFHHLGFQVGLLSAAAHIGITTYAALTINANSWSSFEQPILRFSYLKNTIYDFYEVAVHLQSIKINHIAFHEHGAAVRVLGALIFLSILYLGYDIGRESQLKFTQFFKTSIRQIVGGSFIGLSAAGSFEAAAFGISANSVTLEGINRAVTAHLPDFILIYGPVVVGLSWAGSVTTMKTLKFAQNRLSKKDKLGSLQKISRSEARQNPTGFDTLLSLSRLATRAEARSKVSTFRRIRKNIPLFPTVLIAGFVGGEMLIHSVLNSRSARISEHQGIQGPFVFARGSRELTFLHGADNKIVYRFPTAKWEENDYLELYRLNAEAPIKRILVENGKVILDRSHTSEDLVLESDGIKKLRSEARDKFAIKDKVEILLLRFDDVNADDLDRIYEIELLANKEQADSKDEIKLDLKNPGVSFLAAKMDGKIVGFIWVEKSKDGRVSISNIAIHPDYYDIQFEPIFDGLIQTVIDDLISPIPAYVDIEDPFQKILVAYLFMYRWHQINELEKKFGFEKRQLNENEYGEIFEGTFRPSQEKIVYELTLDIEKYRIRRLTAKQNPTSPQIAPNRSEARNKLNRFGNFLKRRIILITLLALTIGLSAYIYSLIPDQSQPTLRSLSPAELVIENDRLRGVPIKDNTPEKYLETNPFLLTAVIDGLSGMDRLTKAQIKQIKLEPSTREENGPVILFVQMHDRTQSKKIIVNRTSEHPDREDLDEVRKEISGGRYREVESLTRSIYMLVFLPMLAVFAAVLYWLFKTAGWSIESKSNYARSRAEHKVLERVAKGREEAKEADQPNRAEARSAGSGLAPSNSLKIVHRFVLNRYVQSAAVVGLLALVFILRTVTTPAWQRYHSEPTLESSREVIQMGIRDRIIFPERPDNETYLNRVSEAILNPDGEFIYLTFDPENINPDNVPNVILNPYDVHELFSALQQQKREDLSMYRTWLIRLGAGEWSFNFEAVNQAERKGISERLGPLYEAIAKLDEIKIAHIEDEERFDFKLNSNWLNFLSQNSSRIKYLAQFAFADQSAVSLTEAGEYEWAMNQNLFSRMDLVNAQTWLNPSQSEAFSDHISHVRSYIDFIDFMDKKFDLNERRLLKDKLTKAYRKSFLFFLAGSSNWKKKGNWNQTIIFWRVLLKYYELKQINLHLGRDAQELPSLDHALSLVLDELIEGTNEIGGVYELHKNWREALLKQNNQQSTSRSEARHKNNPAYQTLVEGAEDKRPDHEKEPNWHFMNVIGWSLLDLMADHQQNSIPISEVERYANEILDAQGFETRDFKSVKRTRDLIDVLIKIGMIKRNNGMLELSELYSPRAFAIKTDHVFLIKNEFETALNLPKVESENVLENLIRDYSEAVEHWFLFPVEARWPVMKAIALLDRQSHEKLIQFFKSKPELLSLPLVDSILLMLKENDREKWIERNAPNLKDRTLYYISSETWLAAGGLGRVGQYHTVSMKKLMGNVASLATIEPFYFEKTPNGDVLIDYSKLPIPVENLTAEPTMEFTINVSGKDVTAQVFKGTNQFGVEVYLIKDNENYYTKYLYKYGPKYGSASWEEFSEFISKASLELIKRLETVKQKAQGDTYQYPILIPNDGQLAFFPVFKEVSELEAKDSTLLGSLVWQVTHTHRNRGYEYKIGDGENRLLNMGIPSSYFHYYSIHDENGTPRIDYSSGGIRSSVQQGGKATGVSAVHAQRVNIFDLVVQLGAVTNGDNRKFSNEFFRQWLKNSEYPTAGEVIDAKVKSKGALKEDSKIQKLNSRIADVDPDQIMITYSGRLAPEKAGRRRALTDNNIRDLVAAGVQVVIFGNVQPSSESETIYQDLLRLQDEIDRRKLPGKLIFATNWGIPEQKKLLAATDIQIQDSDYSTGAAEYSEADVSANGGLQMGPPWVEGIIQRQGIPINWKVPGSGNTIIPRNGTAAAYPDALTSAIAIYKDDRLKFATYQIASIRLSRILEADITGAEYLREASQQLSSPEFVMAMKTRRYLLRDPNEVFSPEEIRELLVLSAKQKVIKHVPLLVPIFIRQLKKLTPEERLEYLKPFAQLNLEQAKEIFGDEAIPRVMALIAGNAPSLLDEEMKNWDPLTAHILNNGKLFFENAEPNLLDANGKEGVISLVWFYNQQELRMPIFAPELSEFVNIGDGKFWVDDPSENHYGAPEEAFVNIHDFTTGRSYTDLPGNQKQIRNIVPIHRVGISVKKGTDWNGIEQPGLKFQLLLTSVKRSEARAPKRSQKPRVKPLKPGQEPVWNVKLEWEREQKNENRMTKLKMSYDELAGYAESGQSVQIIVDGANKFNLIRTFQFNAIIHSVEWVETEDYPYFRLRFTKIIDGSKSDTVNRILVGQNATKEHYSIHSVTPSNFKSNRSEVRWNYRGNLSEKYFREKPFFEGEIDYLKEELIKQGGNLTLIAQDAKSKYGRPVDERFIFHRISALGDQDPSLLQTRLESLKNWFEFFPREGDQTILQKFNKYQGNNTSVLRFKFSMKGTEIEDDIDLLARLYKFSISQKGNKPIFSGKSALDFSNFLNEIDFPMDLLIAHRWIDRLEERRKKPEDFIPEVIEDIRDKRNVHSPDRSEAREIKMDVTPAVEFDKSVLVRKPIESKSRMVIPHDELKSPDRKTDFAGFLRQKKGHTNLDVTIVVKGNRLVRERELLRDFSDEFDPEEFFVDYPVSIVTEDEHSNDSNTRIYNHITDKSKNENGKAPVILAGEQLIEQLTRRDMRKVEIRSEHLDHLYEAAYLLSQLPDQDWKKFANELGIIDLNEVSIEKIRSAYQTYLQLIRAA